MMDEWMDLNFKQSFGKRNSKVKIYDDSKVKIEKKNILSNITTLHDQI